MNKLDKIKYDLADKYTINYEFGILRPAFIDGFDAAMERVKPLVEALESIAAPHVSMSIFCPVTKTDTIIAREALAKFRG